MTSTSVAPGCCPRCTARIGRGQVLIEYDRTDGSRGLFAECPECRAVVRPE